MNFQKLNSTFSLLLFVFCTNYIFGQSPEKLRDPEFLVEQYNKLVAKHNALIEKTRSIILEQKNAPKVAPASVSPSLQRSLDDAIIQIEVLETEIQNLRNNKPLTNTSSVYLEETNARLQTTHGG